jgi:hypothetical protein
MARLSSSEVLNLILVLTNCQVVVAMFLELAVVAGLNELPATKGRTTEKVARMVVVAEIDALNLIWLRIHEVWLPEVRAKLVRHRGGDAHHCLLLLNPGNILLCFWAPFGAMSSYVILAVEVRISWILVFEFQGSSSPSPSLGCKSSSCAWSVVLVGRGFSILLMFRGFWD